jgi:predicted ABC-type transport system involved in lysophospholipase L1 biosynthesis ATPase subunit
MVAVRRRRAPASRRCHDPLGLDTATAGVARVAGHDLLTRGRATRGLPAAHRRIRVAADLAQLLPYYVGRERRLAMNVARTHRGARARAGGSTNCSNCRGGEARDRRPGELVGRPAAGGGPSRSRSRTRPLVLLADEADRLSSTRPRRIGARGDARRHEELGVTTLIVTHDPRVGHVRRTVQIRDGRTSTGCSAPRASTSTAPRSTSPRSSRCSTGSVAAAPPEFVQTSRSAIGCGSRSSRSCGRVAGPRGRGCPPRRAPSADVPPAASGDDDAPPHRGRHALRHPTTPRGGPMTTLRPRR